MNPKYKKAGKAITFLYDHFDGIGEDHPDHQKGIEATNSVTKLWIELNGLEN